MALSVCGEALSPVRLNAWHVAVGRGGGRNDTPAAPRLTATQNDTPAHSEMPLKRCACLTATPNDFMPFATGVAAAAVWASGTSSARLAIFLSIVAGAEVEAWRHPAAGCTGLDTAGRTGLGVLPGRTSRSIIQL